MKINTILAPGDRLREIKSNDSIVVMIDVLRASSTICAALSNGAREVIPCMTIEEAVREKDSYARDKIILGGERKGLKPEGFDAGNSPLEYDKELVQDKTVVITTTNGTKIFSRFNDAGIRIIGSFINVKIVCDYIEDRQKLKGSDILIVCAGTDGEFTLEDAVCAGDIVNELYASDNYEITDAAIAAKELFLRYKDDLKNLRLPGKHSAYLKSIGFEEDLKFAFHRNSVDSLPIVDGRRIVDERRF